MALNQRLDLRQTQSLVMTPQLQQAIKLLQMSNAEVSQFVEDALQQNPLLEREEEERSAERDGDERARDGAPDDEAPEARLEGAGSDEGSPSMAEDNLWDGDTAAPAPRPAEGEAYSYLGTGGGGTEFDGGENVLEQTLARAETLREHLLDQLNVDITDPIERLIGAHLVDLVDETGYLTGDLGAAASMLDCTPEALERVRARLARFDPPGVFARSLKECLEIQLRERNRLDPAMQALLDNLELLARRDMATLMRVCGVDEADLAEMVVELRALNPKPGLVFDNAVAQPIIPDVLMHADNAGGWIVELNSETLPRVLVNAQYFAQLSRGAKSKDDKIYLTGCFQSANWLVKSLHQRATTILKVATELVRQQDGFFAHGVQFLRPLILRDIAEIVGVHESTVSRVTTNKYIATPRGLYELKYFFTSSIADSHGGAAHSSASVRFRIRAMIDNEPPDDVLSDDKIVEILHKEGVEIARRTVAKYREAMHISSSVQRRRDKGLAQRLARG
ncbi:MAG: RNA polymerase factor sigma-54 [Alphaproteobacteria bacterium]